MNGSGRWLAATVLLIACAASPRPRVLGEADALRLSRATLEAKDLSPQAVAHAEQLRAAAERAYEQGELARAQVLAEQSSAAYHHASAAARVVRAERRLAQAEREKAAAEQALVRLEAEQQRVAAEANDLDLRARVLKDSIPLAPNAKTTPEREQARRDAARALAADARLLCVAARLVDPKGPEVAGELARVDALDQKLAERNKPAPIDDALSARSGCLRQLTLARRAATRLAPANGSADLVLAELGRLGSLYPYRDDRGVVVTLRGLFGLDGALLPAGRQQLRPLKDVAQRHPDFPLLIVIHAAREPAKAAQDARAQALAEALGRTEGLRIELQSVGPSQPLADPKLAASSERNERVEVVFISPTS